MKCICVGVSPKEVCRSFPTMNVSSAIYFDSLADCLHYVIKEPVDIIFVSNDYPREEKKNFAIKLLNVSPSTVILDVDENLDDVVLIKPIPKEDLDETLTLLKSAIEDDMKKIYVRTFGRFTVFKDGKPCSFSGKAKEILALLVTKRGKEVSNEEIYTTIWEERPYSNRNMIVYFNALRRLKKTLKKHNMENLLISTRHGQMVNTELFDCDYYDWLNGRSNAETGFEEEFLSEYSWGEYILSDMISRIHA